MADPAHPEPAGSGRLLRRRAAALTAWAAIVVLGFALGRGAASLDASGPMALAMPATLVAFGLAAAIPFVPGAEIGLGLLMAYGASAALPVWAVMVLALSAAFVAGRLVPAASLAHGFHWVGLHRAARLVVELDRLDPPARELHLAAQLPHWGTPLLRYRYVSLAAVLNLPGNALLGGGGGLALFAGMSRLYRPWAFLLTAGLATAPVPLAVAVAGRAVLV